MRVLSLRAAWSTTPVVATLAVLPFLAGCASILRPVPPADQLLVSREVAGIHLSVPRVEAGAYPDHVLDSATPVYVLIENDGDSDLAIELSDFSLGVPGGMREAPLIPRQILTRSPSIQSGGMSDTADPECAANQPAPRHTQRPVLLAGPVEAVSTPPAPSCDSDNRAEPAPPTPPSELPPPPVYREPRSASPECLASASPADLFWGGAFPYWGWAPSWPGAWYWDSAPYYYPHPRQSIIRGALQLGALPRGARTAGFLYFPRLPSAPEGTTVELHWNVHDAQGHDLHTQLVVPLELDPK